MPSRRTFLLASAATAFAHAQSASENLSALTLAEASRRIHNRSLTSVALTEACLARINAYNPLINAFITVLREQALAQAHMLDSEASAGKFRSPLHGIPLALKDNIDTVGIRTTAASAVFDDRVPTEDAEVTRRLKLAGAVFVGKANLHEFAMGGTSATSYYGPVRNPWSLAHNPGGSSGGSAAAVSTDCCFGALGTDTGGSIRTPASFCSVVGLKPTYGLVSIRGIIPLTYSLDHCGPITRTVEDAAILLNQLTGYDRLDIASVEHNREDYAALSKQPVKDFRIGVLRAPFFDLLDADVASTIETAIRHLATLTKSTRDATLPSTRGITLQGESYAYHEEYFTHGATRYMLSTRHALQASANAKAADYVRARWKLDLLRRTIDDAFADFDLVVLPTRRHTPRTVNASIKREETEKARNPELENTGQFNIYGIPAISVPCGFNHEGMPIGLMIAGPRFSEGKVLALARAYEQSTDWHTRQPPITPKSTVPALAETEDK